MNIKRAIRELLYPVGQPATILWGPLRGTRYIVSEIGWAPIRGAWEPEAQTIFSKIVRRGWCIFDIGANCGVHSLLFSRLVGSAGRVVAFEPLAENVELLRQNLAENSIGNVEIEQVAVADYDGSANFHSASNATGGSLFAIEERRSTGHTTAVKCISLQSFVTAKGIKPDFIKMDVEGAEENIWKSIGPFLQSNRPIFSIESHNAACDAAIGRGLKEHNYQAYRVNRRFGRNDNDRGIPFLREVTDFSAVRFSENGVFDTVIAFPSQM